MAHHQENPLPPGREVLDGAPVSDEPAEELAERQAIEQAAQPWYRRMRARAAQHPMTDTAWRLTVFIIGVTLLLAGAVFLVFPGPGWACIFLGLAVLASEFAWANRAMHPLKRAAARASEIARDPRYRVAVWIVGMLVIAAAVAAGWWYVGRYGWTLDGMPRPFG